MPSSSNRPAFSAAARTCSISAAASPSEKNGRPVLVQIARPGQAERALLAEAAGAAGLAEAAGAAGLRWPRPLARRGWPRPLARRARRRASGTPASTAREPMCFSSHSTDSTPSAR